MQLGPIIEIDLDCVARPTYSRRLSVEIKGHARRAVPRREQPFDFRGQRTHDQPRAHFDDCDLASARCGAGRDLKADEFAADDDQAPAAANDVREAARIRRGTKIQDITETDFRHRELPRFRPSRQQEAPVAEPAAILKKNLLLLGIDRHRARSGAQLYLVQGQKRRLEQAAVRENLDAGQDFLGQRRTLIGRLGFGADQGDSSTPAFSPQRLRGPGPRVAGADNDYALHAACTLLRQCPLRSLGCEAKASIQSLME